ncbi:MAG: carboxylating nicotinate-nucleotide diphosphorylase [Acidimicrobiia bacterium]|nr:carboxylating nicotinate-nucleotide diphosphorylase [Acidimicrobiia bacterium]
MTALGPPPTVIWEPIVRGALVEDLGRAGDVTTNAIVPESTTTTARVVVREAGVVAGLTVACHAFELVDPSIHVGYRAADGDRVEAGATVAVVAGPARGILTAERVALNLLGRLCGIASLTARLVDAVADAAASVVETRKTTPGLRALEKYAVRCGGGSNHRFGLDDAVLIKDNHVAVAGGVAAAIDAARSAVGHLVKIEVEVDTLDQLREALDAGADVVLLDNMGPDLLREAVEIAGGRAVLEASGGITPDTIGAVAATGVDVISLGWLTHSVRALDVGLDIGEPDVVA